MNLADGTDITWSDKKYISAISAIEQEFQDLLLKAILDDLSVAMRLLSPKNREKVISAVLPF